MIYQIKNIEFTDTFTDRNIYNGDYNNCSKALLFDNEAEKDK